MGRLADHPDAALGVRGPKVIVRPADRVLGRTHPPALPVITSCGLLVLRNTMRRQKVLIFLAVIAVRRRDPGLASGV